jgi:site-specific recombinase XerD
VGSWAAGIRRVEGGQEDRRTFRKLLTAEQSQTLWQAPNGDHLKEKRDRALLATLLACGLRRHEAVTFPVTAGLAMPCEKAHPGWRIAAWSWARN